MKIAVILAAGMGSRLQPLTSERPKTMVFAAGKPILEHQLQAYEKAGFDKVYIVAGYRLNVIKEWIYNRPSQIEIELVENTDYATTNNMFSLFLLRDRLQGQSFFLSNGDVVFDSSILDLYRQSDKTKSCIFVDKCVFNEEAMKIFSDSSGMIHGISKHYLKSEYATVSIDLYHFSSDSSTRLFKSMHDFINEKKQKNLWTEVALDQILKTDDHDFQAIDIKGMPWSEIDTSADLSQAELTFSPHRSHIAGAKAFVFDIDGTLAVDGNFLPGALDIIWHLQKEKRVFFCSNNSSRSHVEHSQFLKYNGVSCRPEDILSSIDATISYLRHQQITSFYLLGTPSLRQELETKGFTYSSKDPEIIIVGFDKTLSYETVAHATSLISQGCPYILTHPDTACPTALGPIPDAGAIAAMLHATTGIDPVAILGKPSPSMLQPLFIEHGYRTNEVVMIGDRLTTDIRMAQQIGCLSVLVLTGMTSRLDVERSSLKPNLILENVGKLMTLLTSYSPPVFSKFSTLKPKTAKTKGRGIEMSETTFALWAAVQAERGQKPSIH